EVDRGLQELELLDRAAVLADDVRRGQRRIAEQEDASVRECDRRDEPWQRLGQPTPAGERDRATGRDNADAGQHAEDVAVLAYMDGHVDRQRCERLREEEERSPAIAEVDVPRG